MVDVGLHATCVGATVVVAGVPYVLLVDGVDVGAADVVAGAVVVTPGTCGIVGNEGRVTCVGILIVVPGIV